MPEFYLQIPGENMFDFEPYYSAIAAWLPAESRIVEVGNADGRSAIYLAEKVKSLGKVFHMQMVDSMDYGGRDQFETIFRNISNAGFSADIDLVWKDSLAASCMFPDHYFDFVFLDSSHKYEETKAEFRLWSRKIRPGGLLAGHDYFSTENPGVYDAIQELVRLSEIKIFQTYQTRNALGVWEVQL